MGASVAIQPAKRPSVRAQRAVLEASLETMLAAVEAVVARLDALDGESDLEPSLGSTLDVHGHRDQRDWALTGSDDREHEDEREPSEDDEYELGEPERIDQTRWGDEYNPDGSGLTCCVKDGEPNLSAIEQLDQRLWSVGDRRELEVACGSDTDSEPDDPSRCNWQDEGDQTILRNLPMATPGPASANPRNSTFPNYSAPRDASAFNGFQWRR